MRWRTTGDDPVATRDEFRALLRAHLRAVGPRPHLSRHCLVCHRLQRLTLGLGGREPEQGSGRHSGQSGKNPPSV
ncbi:DUF6274 family protein [Streptomyces sp. ISL-86]|uniref:DUF6274 family protein n=1 Tax=Streptomyces sp. ISL-86 TaxID=2819187 RepID=UPI002035C266|nr:DUF6274 family protein [Streptomyces sp. ISL-86]